MSDNWAAPLPDIVNLEGTASVYSGTVVRAIIFGKYEDYVWVISSTTLAVRSLALAKCRRLAVPLAVPYGFCVRVGMLVSQVVCACACGGGGANLSAACFCFASSLLSSAGDSISSS